MIVPVSDADAADVCAMLKFVYFAALDPETDHDLPALLRLADKYAIAGLTEWCCSAMILKLRGAEAAAVPYLRMLNALQADPIIKSTFEIITALVARSPAMQIAVASEI